MSANDVQNKKLTKEEFDQEMAALDLKMKQLELAEKQDMFEERKTKRDNKGRRARTKGKTLRENTIYKQKVQNGCNHLKGGDGLNGLHGNGDSDQHAVFKHRFSNGDVMIRCLRCGKQWLPVRKADYTVGGKFNADAFKLADQEYKTALAFRTKNKQSGAAMFGFADHGDAYRKALRDSTDQLDLTSTAGTAAE